MKVVTGRRGGPAETVADESAAGIVQLGDGPLFKLSPPVEETG